MTNPTDSQGLEGEAHDRSDGHVCSECMLTPLPSDAQAADEMRDILSKVLIDGQNQIRDLRDGRATLEETTERMFASLDYWQLKAVALMTKAKREGFVAGVTADKRTLDEVVSQAREQERERLLDEMDDIQNHLVHPTETITRWIASHRTRKEKE